MKWIKGETETGEEEEQIMIKKKGIMMKNEVNTKKWKSNEEVYTDDMK